MNHENQSTAVAISCDAELIAAAQRGEEQAFETLFHAYKRKVYSLCRRMTGNTAEAEELTQEAFMQLFRKIQTFRGESSFSTWLHRLAVNIVLMKQRKKSPKEIPIESENENAEYERPQREFGGPDLVLSGVVDRVSLEWAVAKLPPGYRRIFMLHDVMGCEHHEIAAMLGHTAGNSKSQLHKARMRLRKLLRKGARLSTSKTARNRETQGAARPARVSNDLGREREASPLTMMVCGALEEKCNA